MVGLGRVAVVGGVHQRLPGRAGLRAQFVEEGGLGTLLQEGAVQRGIGRGGGHAPVEGHQALVRLLGLGPLRGGQGGDGLLQRCGHAGGVQHRLQLAGEGRGLVVLHGDHAFLVVLAAPGQLRDALGAFRVEPGVGQLHAVAARHGAVVGGAQPALQGVLVVGVQHGVGIAVPVVGAVPAGRGHQAGALLAVGVAAGDLPADVLGVGEHHVQRHGAHFAGGFEGLLHRLRARQIEEGVDRAIRLGLDVAQGQAVAAAQRQRLQRRLALAEGGVEQRAVAGFPDGFADRPLALDEEGFLALAGWLPFAVGHVVEAAALALDLFEEQVLVVAHDHGHAPGQLAVEAGDHCRHAGDRDAGGLEFRRADVHEVPHRRHGERQVCVIGQQALAAAAVLRGDGPVVGGGDAEHVQRGHLAGGVVHRGQPRNLPAQAQAAQLLGFLEGQRLIRVARQQPGQLVRTDLVRQLEGGDFFLQVDRQAEVEQAEQQHRVFRLPVGGAVAALGQVHRQPVLVAEQVGVDAAGVDLEELLDARRGVLVQHLGLGLEVDRTHETVDFQHAGAVHLGQATLGQQAHADHLAEAVGGVHVAQGEQGVVEGGGLDQRHAQRVAPDHHALRQALDANDALVRVNAVGVATVEEGLAAAQQQGAAQGGENGQTEKARTHDWLLAQGDG